MRYQTRETRLTFEQWVLIEWGYAVWEYDNSIPKLFKQYKSIHWC